MLILGHLYVFWYVPIKGNYLLYGKPNCDTTSDEGFGCKDFHSNSHLRQL